MSRKGEQQLKTGPERAARARELAAMYAAPMSIRAIAEQEGRSYTYVHRLLMESGVPLRTRQGKDRVRQDVEL